jgi:hypothetical protein
MSTAKPVLAEMRRMLRASESAIVHDFIGNLHWSMPERRLEPGEMLECLEWLPRCADISDSGWQPVASRLADDASLLRWGQTYSNADFGAGFMRRYGWTEIFGARGHFANEQVAGGFLLLGPEVTYPDHHHVAEEIYIPLTGGTEWRMGGADFAARAAGEVIHHRSNVSHAMRTAAEPLLALYLWRGGPLDQRSTIGRNG